MILLHRVDPDEHMDRWYLVHVQETLFDPVAVVIQYGSRQTAYQQTRIFPVASAAAANELAKSIVAGKVKRGYRVVELDKIS